MKLRRPDDEQKERLRLLEALEAQGIGVCECYLRWCGHKIGLIEMILDERAAAREDERAKVLEECVQVCTDELGAEWTNALNAGAIERIRDAISALATKKGTTP